MKENHLYFRHYEFNTIKDEKFINKFIIELKNNIELNNYDSELFNNPSLIKKMDFYLIEDVNNFDEEKSYNNLKNIFDIYFKTFKKLYNRNPEEILEHDSEINEDINVNPNELIYFKDVYDSYKDKEDKEDKYRYMYGYEDILYDNKTNDIFFEIYLYLANNYTDYYFYFYLYEDIYNLIEFINQDDDLINQEDLDEMIGFK